MPDDLEVRPDAPSAVGLSDERLAEIEAAYGMDLNVGHHELLAEVRRLQDILDRAAGVIARLITTLPPAQQRQIEAISMAARRDY